MFVSPNELRRSIESSNPTIGTWMQIPSAEIAEILSATESYDWIVVDMEHGSFSRENLPSIIRAIEKYNVLPFVRLKTNDTSSVKDIVDCGFCGYIAPMIGSASQLKKIYEEFTYPPLGKRGVGFSRSNQYGINFDKKVKEGINPFLVAMIETKQGLENIESILGYENLDAIIIGPYDLSSSLGICGQFDNQIFIDAYNYLKNSCLKYNLPFGIHLINPDNNELQKIVESGASFIPFSMDSVMLHHPKPKV